MNYVITPASQPGVAVAGSHDKFPVHRIYCVGRNYAAHAREMGIDPSNSAPIFFSKPADAIVPATSAKPVNVPYPSQSHDFQHEIELVVAIGRGGRDIPCSAALDYVWGYTVGLDMTRRDLQTEARKRGEPWDTAKAFDHSAPIGLLHPASRIGHPVSGAIWLDVNGERRQEADLEQLIWSVPDIIHHLSRYFELAPGDLVYTGTPSGVGPVKRGDHLSGGIDELGEINVKII
ncbi:MAG: fumarylacetoacetate hydrolase family protein [Rugosibacter sp.]|nr:fumarylacetoacetate hydrolase family protein [Rugosibacter sp.]